MKYTYLFILILLLLGASGLKINQAYSAERFNLERCHVFTNNSDTIYIGVLDYSLGLYSVIDSINTLDSSFNDPVEWTSDIDWSLYDSVHRRVFFQEAFTSSPIHIHVYELNTHRYFNLPYDNYMGEHPTMLISPGSRYVIFTYMFSTDTTWSINLYKTVVLDGEDLHQISEKVGIEIGDEPQSWMSFIAQNNNYLINPDQISTSDTTKEQAFVIYTLPDLNPIDTIFFGRYQWRGSKKVRDISADGILFVATKTDTTRGLPPGNYGFVVGWPNRRLQTRFVPLAPGINYDAKLSPDGDEIDVLYPSEGKLRRYPVARGRMLGEIDVPIGSGFNFYGTDSNLYLKSQEENIVVDYKHNRIVRRFYFSEE